MTRDDDPAALADRLLAASQADYKRPAIQTAEPEPSEAGTLAERIANLLESAEADGMSAEECTASALAAASLFHVKRFGHEAAGQLLRDAAAEVLWTTG